MRRAERMHWATDSHQEAVIGVIEADQLHAIPGIDLSGHKLAHRLGQTTVRRRKTIDDVKYIQRRPRCL
jgi:hypothetical protein